jgi:TatD DNase family protein
VRDSSGPPEPGITWVDSHCHIPDTDEGRLQINRAVDAGVVRMVSVGTDAATSSEAIKVAKAAGQTVRATVGLHPHDAKNGIEEVIAILDDAIAKEDHPIVGIGECGLDYFYDHSPREKQREIFARQIALAKQHDLALVIHTRDAWADTFDILRAEIPPSRTIIHCFTGGPDEARTCLDLGFYLSFSGIVTFPKSIDVLEAAHLCPIDQLLIETDSPFLSPIPFRGKPNEPAKVAVIGEFLSVEKKVQVERFAEQISTNSRQVFRLQSLQDPPTVPNSMTGVTEP